MDITMAGTDNLQFSAGPYESQLDATWRILDSLLTTVSVSFDRMANNEERFSRERCFDRLSSRRSQAAATITDRRPRRLGETLGGTCRTSGGPLDESGGHDGSLTPSGGAHVGDGARSDDERTTRTINSGTTYNGQRYQTNSAGQRTVDAGSVESEVETSKHILELMDQIERAVDEVRLHLADAILHREDEQ